MKYPEALKRTALILPLALFDRGLWETLGETAGALLLALASLFARLAAIALYPLAVPILAALVIEAERRERRARERRRAELHARFDRP
jgi:hypothetical protein